jgi:hypothetical protein
MKTINRIIITAFTIILCGIGIGIFTMYLIGNRINKKEAEIKKHLGETIVINKDTLLITDYSFLNSTYKLSNGSEISFDYYNKTTHKK